MHKHIANITFYWPLLSILPTVDRVLSDHVHNLAQYMYVGKGRLQAGACLLRRCKMQMQCIVL